MIEPGQTYIFRSRPNGAGDYGQEGQRVTVLRRRRELTLHGRMLETIMVRLPNGREFEVEESELHDA